MPVIYYGEEFGKQGKRAKYLGTEPYDHDEFIREPMSWFRALSFVGDKKTAWNIDFAKTNASSAALMRGAGVCKAANPDYPFILYMAADDQSSWAAQKDDAGSLFAHYKKLVAIRKANPLLTDLSAQRLTVQNTADVYEFQVSKAGQALTVVLSRKSTGQTITRVGMSKDLISGTTASSFPVSPYGALILQ
jgi:glycosidase